MMAKGTVQQLVWGLGWLMCAASVQAQNPLIMDQFTADPTARVFDGKIYVYPSHDILPPPDARADWFCMADYHVFSSENLMDWTDHGVIGSQTNMPWVDAATYDGPKSMIAPWHHLLFQDRRRPFKPTIRFTKTDCRFKTSDTHGNTRGVYLILLTRMNRSPQWAWRPGDREKKTRKRRKTT